MWKTLLQVHEVIHVNVVLRICDEGIHLVTVGAFDGLDEPFVLLAWSLKELFTPILTSTSWIFLDVWVKDQRNVLLDLSAVVIN